MDADVKAESAGASSWSIPGMHGTPMRPSMDIYLYDAAGLGSVTGMLKSLTGQKELTAADLEKGRRNCPGLLWGTRRMAA